MAETTTSVADVLTSVERALPELTLIQDPGLRQATTAIWAETLAESEWQSIWEAPKNPETLPESRRLLEHSRSVALQALAVAEIIERVHGIGFNRDELVAAALLHDVSKLLEYGPGSEGAGKSEKGRKIQHGFLGALKAVKHGMPLDVVHNIIVHTHNSRHMPQTHEAIIVHYVDYLDSDALLFAEHRPLLLKK